MSYIEMLLDIDLNIKPYNMKINMSNIEMMLVADLINEFVHKKESSVSKRIKPAGVKKLKQVELRMAEMLIPELHFSRKRKTKIYKETINDFFPNGYQEE